MRALHRKLLRDLIRLWPQALAIAFVMAAGAATLILGVGAHASLAETREAYYERYRFADVFSSLTRAPRSIADDIAQIEGVSAVEARIQKMALLDIPGMVEPASALVVSLPDVQQSALNRLHLRSGRLPVPGDEREAVISEAFAKAHGFELGSGFQALLNGRKRSLHIVGIALSPEFIYALGPWDLMPDDRRFGIVWMSEKTLAAAYDLTGAFSNVAVKLLPYASESAVIERIDGVLARYGGLGAIGRKDQVSHAFLDAELKQLKAMSRILPPIFLVVAAFLVNMTLARLVSLEREQIGLLKAIGYTDIAVGLHYLQFVSVIAAVGAVIGIVAGTWLGGGLTRLYSDFFHFPFLVFRIEPEVYLLAVGTTVVAALAGGWRAVQSVVRLPPAVAMSPPAPTRYRQFMTGLFRVFGRISQTVTMVVRHLSHGWVRTFSSIFGIALAGAILVGSLWSFDSIDFMIDVTFHLSDRQDATISFTQEQPLAALFEAARLPGVLRAEAYRSVSVKLKNGHLERRVAIVGKPPAADLSRVLDQTFSPVRLPETGIALSDMLARILDAKVGDVIEAELLEKDHRVVQVPVTAIIQGYLGLMSFMDVEALNRLVREGSTISGVHLIFDEMERVPLLQKLKTIPAANFIALQRVSLQKFRETLAQNILFMISVYVTLAVIIVFGVIYNFARISLSEQGREIASLRVLGFTRTEASSILLAEIFILVAAAQPLGWAIGSGLAYMMVRGFESELYRVPLVLGPSVYAQASLIVFAAAIVAALIVRRRIDRLDMIEVLKTRE